MKKTYEQKLFVLVLVLIAIVLVSSSKSNPAIDRWRKLKFGLFIHWGIFSQLSDKVNITSSDVSSWPIEWESRSWSNNLVKTKDDMKKFREFYWGMSKTFNPSKFDPNKWADYAWKAGMRYIVMTTKHHDGFSMYKTELDDYSVVGSECPFKVDAFGESMKAFKKKGFTLGAYYSKADWHRKDFWKPEIFGDTRHINYDPKKYPDTWASFRSFTQGQIHEIGKLYKPDILWFDGGWIKPTYEDLRWDEIAEDARKINPEVIIVNRQGGYYEDYITPEQGGIPDVPLVKPWELCQTMTSQWSFKRGEKYKDTKEILSTLLSVVAKGGSYLLDIGPTAEGEFAPEAIQRLEELAEWMKVNEEGIHDSEPVAPYTFSVMITNSTAEVPFFLTRKAEVIYVYCMYDILPPKINMPFIRREGMGDLSPFSLLDIKLLGSTSKLKFTYENDGLVVYLPKDIDPPGRHAFGFKLLLE